MPLGRSGYGQAFRDPTQIVGATGDLMAMAGLGEIQPHRGKTYVYGRLDDGVGNVAAAAGNAVYWKDLTNYVFTTDFSDSLGGGTELVLCAGILLYAMADGRYGWIQCGGEHTNVFLSGAGAVGQRVIPSTTDGQLTTVATGAVTAAQAGAQRVGTQLAAAVANRGRVYLEIQGG